VAGMAVEHLCRSKRVERMGEKRLLNYSAASVIALKSGRLITLLPCRPVNLKWAVCW